MQQNDRGHLIHIYLILHLIPSEIIISFWVEQLSPSEYPRTTIG